MDAEEKRATSVRPGRGPGRSDVGQEVQSWPPKPRGIPAALLYDRKLSRGTEMESILGPAYGSCEHSPELGPSPGRLLFKGTEAVTSKPARVCRGSCCQLDFLSEGAKEGRRGPRRSSRRGPSTEPNSAASSPRRPGRNGHALRHPLADGFSSLERLGRNACSLEKFLQCATHDDSLSSGGTSGSRGGDRGAEEDPENAEFVRNRKERSTVLVRRFLKNNQKVRPSFCMRKPPIFASLKNRALRGLLCLSVR